MLLEGLWGSMFSRKHKGAKRLVPWRFRHKVSLTVGDAVPIDQASAASLEKAVRALEEDRD